MAQDQIESFAEDDASAVEAKIALIAAQNDLFRKGWGMTPVQGRIVMTRGVAALDPLTQAEVIDKVRQFDAFTEDNDPWGTHEFGIVTVSEDGYPLRVYWKLDLYDTDYVFGSDCPEDPGSTRRVLTLLLPEEY